MNSGFSSLLYVNFIIKKKYRVDDVAKEMRIATDTLYRYVRGENLIPPDRIIDLVKATGDIEYLEFFCDPCGFVPIPQSKARLSKEEREKEQIRLSILTGKALEEIEKAYEDGELDRSEIQKIEKALLRLEAKVVELKEKIKKEVEL